MLQIKIKGIIAFLFLLVPIIVSAQASGGQIKRKPSSPKTEVKKTTKQRTNRSEGNEIKREKAIKLEPYRYNPDVVEPLPLSSLATYNVVACSARDIEKARIQCRDLRGKGYHSEIYKDPNMGIYQILIGLTNNEQEAINLKNRAKGEYKRTWILYIVDGVQQIYR